MNLLHKVSQGLKQSYTKFFLSCFVNTLRDFVLFVFEILIDLIDCYFTDIFASYIRFVPINDGF